MNLPAAQQPPGRPPLPPGAVGPERRPARPPLHARLLAFPAAPAPRAAAVAAPPSSGSSPRGSGIRLPRPRRRGRPRPPRAPPGSDAAPQRPHGMLHRHHCRPASTKTPKFRSRCTGSGLSTAIRGYMARVIEESRDWKTLWRLNSTSVAAAARAAAMSARVSASARSRAASIAARRSFSRRVR